MKIVFCDIDGVMNTAHELKRQMKETGTCSQKIWCDKAVTNLFYLCQTCRAKVVVSSSWRIGKTVEQLRDYYEDNHFHRSFIIGKTPTIQEIHHSTWNDSRSYCRGHEIKDWLDRHDVEGYVILDDDTDFLDEQLDNFVYCNTDKGFAENEALDNAIKILTK